MEVNHENFVGVYRGAFTADYCDSVITMFDKCHEAGFTLSRQEHDGTTKTVKEDSSLFTKDAVMSAMALKEFRLFNDILWDVLYPNYSSKYDILEGFDSHGSYEAKIQKTEVGGGYHVWHCESSSRSASGRIMAWILYLNDVEEGGETEFLYQHKRYKPEKGTFVMFPAGYTHAHRGNPPLSNTKYIMTGWIEF